MSESLALVATDSDNLDSEVKAALGGNFRVLRVRAGSEVLPAIVKQPPAIVILDLQIGNMGGMATCLNLRLEQRAGRIGPQRIVLLLDREADAFLGKKSEADSWLVKPIDPLVLRQTANQVLGN